MKNEFFQDWLFHYNPYIKKWAAFTRENCTAYFSGDYENPEILRSSKIDTLLAILTRCDGDPQKIRKFVSSR